MKQSLNLIPSCSRLLSFAVATFLVICRLRLTWVVFLSLSVSCPHKRPDIGLNAFWSSPFYRLFVRFISFEAFFIRQFANLQRNTRQITFLFDPLYLMHSLRFALKICLFFPLACPCNQLRSRKTFSFHASPPVSFGSRLVCDRWIIRATTLHLIFLPPSILLCFCIHFPLLIADNYFFRFVHTCQPLGLKSSVDYIDER